MKRKTPRQGAMGQMRIIASKSEPIEAPSRVKLNEEETELFYEYVATRERTEWSKFDLIQLCRAIKLESLALAADELVLREGQVVEGVNGGKARHPASVSGTGYHNRALSLFRMLGLGLGNQAPQTQFDLFNDDAPKTQFY